MSLSPSDPAVLVVDDDAGVRNLVTSVLEDAGLRVLAAADGQTAVELLRTNPRIDLVLLDVKMPKPDGPQTLDLLWKIKPGLPCCFVTGNPAPYSVPGLLAMGAQAVLDKPFLIKALVAAVKELLKGRESPEPEGGLVS
jgi:CheY-like chemotaxis protein